MDVNYQSKHKLCLVDDNQTVRSRFIFRNIPFLLSWHLQKVKRQPSVSIPMSQCCQCFHGDTPLRGPCPDKENDRLVYVRFTSVCSSISSSLSSAKDKIEGSRKKNMRPSCIQFSRNSRWPTHFVLPHNQEIVRIFGSVPSVFDDYHKQNVGLLQTNKNVRSSINT